MWLVLPPPRAARAARTEGPAVATMAAEWAPGARLSRRAARRAARRRRARRLLCQGGKGCRGEQPGCERGRDGPAQPSVPDLRRRPRRGGMCGPVVVQEHSVAPMRVVCAAAGAAEALPAEAAAAAWAAGRAMSPEQAIADALDIPSAEGGPQGRVSTKAPRSSHQQISPILATWARRASTDDASPQTPPSAPVRE